MCVMGIVVVTTKNGLEGCGHHPAVAADVDRARERAEGVSARGPGTVAACAGSEVARVVEADHALFRTWLTHDTTLRCCSSKLESQKNTHLQDCRGERSL